VQGKIYLREINEVGIRENHITRNSEDARMGWTCGSDKEDKNLLWLRWEDNIKVDLEIAVCNMN
jgi:hypothetical protein